MSKLCSIFSKVLNINETECPNLKRESCRNWDSIKHMDLIFCVEDEFEVTFAENEIPVLTTYKAFYEALVKYGVM